MIHRIAATLAQGAGVGGRSDRSGSGNRALGLGLELLDRIESALHGHRIERGVRFADQAAGVRAGGGLAADIGEAERGGLTGRAVEAVETVFADRAEIVQARRPVGADLNRMIVSREADGGIDGACQRLPLP